MHLRLISGLVLAFTSIAMSCGKPKIEAHGLPIDTNPRRSSDNLAVDKKEYNGIWTTECFQAGSGLFGLGYQRRELSIDGKNFTMVVGAYSDAACTDASMTKILIAEGKLSIGSKVEKAGALEADFDTQSISLVALTDDAAAWLNTSGGTCGKDNWIAGEVVPVKDSSGCDHYYTLGLVPYHLIARQDDALYLGTYYQSEDIGLSPDNRPSKIADHEVYTKSGESIFGMTSGEDEDNSDTDPTPITPNTPTLTMSELVGRWSAPSGTLIRGTSSPLSAQAVRFVFSYDEEDFSLNYGICSHPTSCSGQDAYGRMTGTVNNGSLVVSCEQNGVRVNKEIGSVSGASLKILSMQAFSMACPTERAYVEVTKNADNTFSMTAVADNYGEVITGTATITKQ